MMPGFTSRWLEWESSETPVQRTDKTDRRGKKAAKGASGGSVGSSDGGLGLKTTSGGNAPQQSGVDANTPAAKTPIQQADKTDKRLLGSNAGARGGVWDAETARLIEWFMRTPPPAQPFELCQGVTVARPDIWWASLRQDIAEGPGGPRAHYGVVQSNLKRLAKLFGGPVRLRP